MRSPDLLLHYRQIAQQPLTIVDVETTGILASNSRITEISVLQATLAEGIYHQQTDLINPQTQIPAKIVQVTGITQRMVNVAPVAADVLPRYLDRLRSGILTAHNLEFDYSFLKAEFTRLGLGLIRSETQQLCTVRLARQMLPDLPSRSLPVLVRHFQFQVGASHRAEADAHACWLLAKRLLTEIMNESDEILLAKFVREWLPLKEAVALLGYSSNIGRSQLEAAGISSRYVGQGKNGTWMYRRGDVERVFAENH